MRSIWAYEPVITGRLGEGLPRRRARADRLDGRRPRIGCGHWRGSASTGSAPTILGCSSSSPPTRPDPPRSRLQWRRAGRRIPPRPRGGRRGEAGRAGAAADPDRVAPGAVMALVAMGLGVIVIANDFTALNVALPAIEQDFNVDVGHGPVGDQRLLPRLRHGDRHRRAAGRHVRPPARVLPRLGDLRRLLAARRRRAGRALADRDQGRDGDRRGADVAGDPRDDLRGAAARARRAWRAA